MLERGLTHNERCLRLQTLELATMRELVPPDVWLLRWRQVRTLQAEGRHVQCVMVLSYIQSCPVTW